MDDHERTAHTVWADHLHHLPVPVLERVAEHVIQHLDRHTDGPPEWPGWMPGYERVPARWHGPQRQPPRGIVLHCGHTDGDLVAYTRDPPDGRRVSYHIVIDRKRQQVVQMVSLHRRAWHAGRWGNDWIGIALRGPAALDPRPKWERETLRRVVSEVCEAFGGWLAYWCRHSDDPKGHRHDPGPGVTEAWMDGLGLRHVPPHLLVDG